MKTFSSAWKAVKLKSPPRAPTCSTESLVSVPRVGRRRLSKVLRLSDAPTPVSSFRLELRK